MSLIEYTLEGKINKVDDAIKRLKAFEPEEGYIVCDSGGKDSTVVYTLAKMAGVKHESVYNVTSVDPPELVRFLKEKHPDTRFQHSHYADGKVKTMWTLIKDNKCLPTQTIRYCCAALKEAEHKGRLCVTGVRWAEGVRRRKNQGMVKVFGRKKSDDLIMNDDNDEARRTVEHCYRTQKTLVNPIVDWEDEDVWEFIKAANIPYCELYDCGYKRLGCIGCPMATTARKKMDFERYPKYKENYLRAIEKLPRKKQETAEEMLEWWISGKAATQDTEDETLF